jgi:hypothetical protein
MKPVHTALAASLCMIPHSTIRKLHALSAYSAVWGAVLFALRTVPFTMSWALYALLLREGQRMCFRSTLKTRQIAYMQGHRGQSDAL